MIKNIISVLFFLGLSAAMSAQNAHPYFRHYTTDDGLPSPEVHVAMEDNDGYMWFATDNGLSRFDGYTFKNYGQKEGLKNNVVLLMDKDAAGTIWLATLSGNIYQILGDSIVPYVYNDVIAAYFEGRNLIDFLIDSSQTVHVSIFDIGILSIDKYGKDKLTRPSDSLGRPFIYETPKRLMRGDINVAPSFEKVVYDQYSSKGIIPTIQWINKSSFNLKGEIPVIRTSNSGFHLFEFFEDYLSLTISDLLFEIKNDRLLLLRKLNNVYNNKALLELSDKQILLGVQTGGGVEVFKNIAAFRDNWKETYLQNNSISHIYQDAKDGLWFTSIENGVFYCPQWDYKIFDESIGLPNANITSIAFRNEQEIYLGLRTGVVYLYNLMTHQLELLPDLPYKSVIYDLHYEASNNTLFAANGVLNYFDNKAWKQFFYPNPFSSSSISGLPAKQISISSNQKSIWSGGHRGFNKIGMSAKQISFVSINENITQRTFFAKETQNEQLWLGVVNGFYAYKNGQLLQPQPWHPAMETRAEDMVEMPDSTLIIATKGAGILIWKDSFFQQLTTDDGLLSDLIENLHLDKQQRLWVGTLNGLNRISFSENQSSSWPKSLKVERFTVQNGLPSNEINQVKSYKGQVWVATTKGLVQWTEPTQNTTTIPPILTELTVNNQPVKFVNNQVFSHDQNNLVFHFLTINYKMNGKIPYRYRLNQEEWTQTQNTNLNFLRLSPDDYSLEIQSQNESGRWSKSLSIPFSIQAPWWSQWWFYGLSALAISLMFWSVYRYRMSNLKHELSLQQQISDLEKSALQAQMNPHFIFNTLNSIQSYILQNQPTKAVTYLSRFAKLVRHSLDASIHGKVTLEDEVAMLDNYLALEQERFNHRFAYSITISEEIADEFMEIPSMLIQPFVENAVLHGMAGKKADGKIDLVFDKIDEGGILVKVKDNGGGFRNNGKPAKIPRHKSAGISITQKRLELLNKRTDNVLKIEPIKAPNGSIIGTVVSIFVKTNES